MSAIHWGTEFPQAAERLPSAYRWLIRSREIEIGIGATAWAGLVFFVVHFGTIV
jgi:hypothetical protein